MVGFKVHRKSFTLAFGSLEFLFLLIWFDVRKTISFVFGFVSDTENFQVLKHSNLFRHMAWNESWWWTVNKQRVHRGRRSKLHEKARYYVAGYLSYEMKINGIKFKWNQPNNNGNSIYYLHNFWRHVDACFVHAKASYKIIKTIQSKHCHFCT